MASRDSGKKPEGGLLSDFTIRKKILLIFSIIGIILAAQSVVSFIVLSQMQDSNDNINTQGNISKISINIASSQNLEQRYVENYLNALPSGQREAFNSTKIETDSYLTELVDLVENLPEDLADDINKTGAENILNLIQNTRATYLGNVYSIFGFPSFGLANQLKIDTNNIETLVNEITFYTYEFAFTNETLERNKIDPTNSSSLFAELNVFRTELIQNLNILTNENIDQDLYDTLKNSYIVPIENNLTALEEQVTTITDITSQESPNSMNNTEYASLLTEFDTLETIVSDLGNYLFGVTLQLDIKISNLVTLNNISNQNSQLISGFAKDLVSWSEKATEFISSQIDEISSLLEGIIYLVLFVVFIFVMLIILYFFYNIIKPINSMSVWSEKISEGNLTQTLPRDNRRDEIGILKANFKTMNSNLRNIIAQVQNTARIISHTSEDLAASTEEVNATAEEVSAIAQAMAKGSTQQAEIITTIVDEMHKSSQVVDNVVQQITENLAIIRDLSEQTNVLALNTAIEAANAGEFGKGFAVIAENIRKMSEETKNTSRDVSQSSREILETLQSSFGKMTDMIENVASVSEETAASAEEVAASAEEMTASMQNISASSTMLNKQSDDSLEEVEKFKIE